MLGSELPDGKEILNLIFIGFIALSLVGASATITAASHTPDPDLDVSHTETATVGEEFTITVDADNYGGDAGKYSSISVSFPNHEEADHISDVSHDFGSDGYQGTYEEWDTIWDKSGSEMYADYALVEAGLASGSWDEDEDHSLSMDITPEETGTFVFYVRVALPDKDTGERYTAPGTSSYEDQQGFAVKKYTVEVEPKEPDVDASVDADSGTYKPGDDVEYDVTLDNNGGSDEWVWVEPSAAGPDGDQYSGNGEWVEVDAYDREEIEVDFDIPDDAESGDYDARVGVYKNYNKDTEYAADEEWNEFEVETSSSITVDVRHETYEQANEVNALLLYKDGELYRKVTFDRSGELVGLEHTFSDLPPDEYQVSAYINDQDAGNTGKFTVTAGESIDKEITVDDPVWIKPRVLHSDGTPLEGATVKVYSHERDMADEDAVVWRSADTNAQGYVEVPNNDGKLWLHPTPGGKANQYYVVEVYYDGELVKTKTLDELTSTRDVPIYTDIKHTETTLTEVLVSDRSNGDGTFRIGETVAIGPTVRNDGSKMPIRVKMQFDTDGDGSPDRIDLDGDGTLDKKTIVRGDTEHTVVESGDTQSFGLEYVPQTTGTTRVSVTTQVYVDGGWKTTEQSGWTKEFNTEATTLSGTVTAEGSGNGVSGATIYMDGEQVGKTNSDGSYSVAVQSLGEYTLRVEVSDFKTTSRSITLTSSSKTVDVSLQAKKVDVDFEVSKKSGMDGYSVDGEPVVGATVRINGTDYTTDGEGSVALELQPGKYGYTVSADGYESKSGEIDIDPSADTGHIIGVALVRTGVGVTEISVVDANGDPLGANTYRVMVDGEQVTPNAKGELLLEKGTHVIRIKPTEFGENEGLSAVEREVTVTEGKRTTETFYPTGAQLNVEIPNSGRGDVTIEPPGRKLTSTGSERVDAGAEVTLTAKPAEGYSFDQWLGDIPESKRNSPTITLTVKDARKVVATFANGSVDIEASRTTTVAGSPISLRAKLSDGISVSSYDWRVVQAPEGDSGATPMHDEERITSFRPEAPGEYVIELTVTTESGEQQTARQTITVEERSSLIDKYAPIVHFHEDETYFPTPFEAYVRNATLTGGGEPNPTLWDLADAHTDSYLVPNGSESEYPKYDNGVPPTIYASVHPDVKFRNEQYTAVTYWLFYVYDPKGNPTQNAVAAHPSDTESITILLQDGEAKWIGASQHKDGERREWSKVNTDGTHPHIYPAKGAHSNYLRDTSKYSGNGIILQRQSISSHEEDENDSAVETKGGGGVRDEGILDSVSDETGGGPTWSHNGSVGTDYEIAVLTGDEPWQTFPGSMMDDNFALENALVGISYGEVKPPAQRTRWKSIGKWLSAIQSDQEQVDAKLLSLEVTNDREVTATVTNSLSKPHTFWLRTQAKPEGATWESDRVHTETVQVPVGTLSTREVSVTAVPKNATGNWDVRSTLRTYPLSVAETEDEHGTQTVSLTDIDPGEPSFNMSIATNVTSANLDTSTPPSPYLAVRVTVTGAADEFNAENLSLSYSRPNDLLDSSASFQQVGSGEYVAYIPYKLGNVTYTVTAHDEGHAHREMRERFMRPVVFSTDDYFGVYYGSEPVSKSTLQKIEEKGATLALKKSSEVAIGKLLVKIGVTGGEAISKKVFALATFLGKMIPQNGYGFSSSHADVYLATNSSKVSPGFDSTKTVAAGESVYPIFDAYADLKDPLSADHSLSARIVDGETAARYETDLVHPYGRGEYVVIPREPVTVSPDGLDAGERREYAVVPEYRAINGANATLYVTGDGSTPTDETAPTIDSVVPESGSVVARDAAITIDYQDDESTVDPENVTIQVGEETLSVDATTTQATASLSDLGLSSGTHTLTVTVADEHGNERTYDHEFTVDAEKPSADIDVNETRVSPTSPTEITATVTDQSLQTATLQIVNVSTGETVLERSLSEGQTNVVWDAVIDQSSLLPAGTYAVRVTATDAVEQSATTSRELTVETEAPTVSLGTVTAGSESATATAGEVVSANDTVTVTGTVASGSAPVEQTNVTLSAAFTNYEYTTTATVADDGSWTATVDATDLPDDGTYLVSATAIGTYGLTETRTATTTVGVDRDSPTVTARVIPTTGSLDTVVVTSNERLDQTPSLVAELPDGSTKRITLTSDGDTRWDGTFPAEQSGTYHLSVTGADDAGNPDTATVSTAVETDFTPDRDGTVTVGGDRTDSFTVLHLSDDAHKNLSTDAYAALNSLNASPMDLTADRQGAGFLAGELSAGLSDAVTKATLAIPVDSSRVPEGRTAADLDIHYYNETSGQWEQLDTLVQTRTVPGSDGDTRRYWVTNVTHFSVYGVVASDDRPPELESATPTGTVTAGDQTVTFEYADNESGVNASKVTLQFDGKSVTDVEAATVTGDRATYEASDLTTGEYTARVTVVDEAGNKKTYTRTFEISADQQAPSATIETPKNGTTFDPGTTSVELDVTYTDGETGVNTSSVVATLDSESVTDAASITTSGLTYTASGLTNGSTHTFTVVVRDDADNEVTKNVTFTVGVSDTEDENDGTGGDPGDSSDPPEPPVQTSVEPIAGGTMVDIQNARSGEQFTASLDVRAGAATLVYADGTFTGKNSHLVFEFVGESGLSTGVSSPADMNALGHVSVSAKYGSASVLGTMTLEFDVPANELPAGTDFDDVSVYQVVDGELERLDATYQGATNDFVVETDELSTFVVGVSTNESAESTTTETTTGPTDTTTTDSTSTTTTRLVTSETTNPTTTTRTSNSSEGIPGFGFGPALVAILVGLLFARRHN